MSEATRVPGLRRSVLDIPEYKGLLSWISSVDHKQIGLMYIATSILFLLVRALEHLVKEDAGS